MSGSARGFDPVAAGYDQVACSAIGRHYRDRVAAVVDRFLTPGARVLDIGCGTGLDAARLAGDGHRVTAIDGSAEMVALATARLGPAVEVRQQDIDTIDRTDLVGPFDLVLANFGVVNCIRDLKRFGRWLHQVLAESGVAVLVTMAPVCPPELAQAAVTRNRALAGRRRQGDEAPYGGAAVRYYSARRLADTINQEDEARLVLERASAIGVVLPTFEQRDLVENRPRLLSMLGLLDRLAAGPAAATSIGDHQIAVFSKRARP